MLALLLAAATVSTDFEGGNLGRIERVSATHFRLALKGQKDQDGRNRQANWYYFRIDHATPGVEMRLDLVDLPGEYNYKPNRGAVTRDTPAVISHDRENWRHITTFDYGAAGPVMTLRVTPEKSTFWIAHTPPYTNGHLQALRRLPGIKESTIGKSVEGRPLYLWTIGDGPKTAWLMFRQHAWESGSSWAGDGAVRALLADASLRQGVTWKIFPLCDPDGVAHGGVRFNTKGFDLNRNWDVSDPSAMPEIAAQRGAVDAWIAQGRTVDFFLSLHNTETSEYLEGPPNGAHTALAQRLFQLLKTETSFAPTRELFSADVTTTAGKTGRMTVSQGLYARHKIAAFIMEQRISHNPRLGHLPGIADRTKFGAELVQAIAKALR